MGAALRTGHQRAAALHYLGANVPEHRGFAGRLFRLVGELPKKPVMSFSWLGRPPHAPAARSGSNIGERLRAPSGYGL
jgi:hypothetical protein